MRDMMETENRPAFEEVFARTAGEPVYAILGVQGSGTNLLSRMFSRCFGASVLKDQSVVFAAAAALPDAPTTEQVTRAFDTLHGRLVPDAWRRKTLYRVVTRAQADFADVSEAFRPDLVRTPADFARFFYAYRAFRRGAPHMAIKSDDLWEHIEHIDRVLPIRRTILLTRDFRDNALSITGKDFGPVEPVAAARYVSLRLTQYERVFDRDGASASHVKFEDLLGQPVEVMHRLAAQYGLAFVRDVGDVVEELKLRPGKVGKWRALPPDELRRCEGVLRTHLERWHYGLETDAEPATAVQMAATLARDGVKRVPQKVRKLIRRTAR